MKLLPSNELKLARPQHDRQLGFRGARGGFGDGKIYKGGGDWQMYVLMCISWFGKALKWSSFWKSPCVKQVSNNVHALFNSLQPSSHDPTLLFITHSNIMFLYAPQKLPFSSLCPLYLSQQGGWKEARSGHMKWVYRLLWWRTVRVRACVRAKPVRVWS